MTDIISTYNFPVQVMQDYGKLDPAIAKTLLEHHLYTIADIQAYPKDMLMMIFDADEEKINALQYSIFILTECVRDKTEISELGLTLRTYNCLRRNNIQFVAQAIVLSDRELLKLHGFGKVQLTDFRRCLHNNICSYEVFSRVIHEQVDRMVKSHPEGIKAEDIVSNFPVHFTENEWFHTLLNEYLTSDKFDRFSGRYVKNAPSVLDYLLTLDDRSATILTKRLSGLTLDDIAADFGVTRERIRQICVRSMRRRPSVLHEDRYRVFYETYNLSRQTFCFLFGVEPYVYNYFTLIGDCQRGFVPFSEFVLDKRIPEDVRQRGMELLHENDVLVCGEYVRRNRSDIIKALMKHNHSDKPCRVDEIYQEYMTYCFTNGLDDLFCVGDERKYKHAFENYLLHQSYILLTSHKRFRYYEVDGMKVKRFFDSIDFASYLNLSISSLRIFNDYPDLMAEYDIQSEFELHNLIRHYLKFVPSFVRLSKMPMLNIGTVDRAAQVMDLLKESMPISRQEFVSLAANTYGVGEKTFAVNWLGYVEKYFCDGQYAHSNTLFTVS